MKITATYFFPPDIVEQSHFECGIIPHSLAYFCTTCGTIWGRISCESEGASSCWTVECCPCPHHAPTGVPDWSRYAGTITEAFPTTKALSQMWWGRAIEHLPPTVLRQEFTRLLNHLTKDML